MPAEAGKPKQPTTQHANQNSGDSYQSDTELRPTNQTIFHTQGMPSHIHRPTSNPVNELLTIGQTSNPS